MPRLGVMLVQAGWATEESVIRALEIQRVAGGRLGTLLLESGALAETQLGQALAQQHGCEYIPWGRLSAIAPETVALLPVRFATRHSAIPYDRGEGLLRVVLRDPQDLRILDELFFVTGRKIVPAVAPEVRIYQALEKYYGERRTPRFAILAERLSRSAAASRVLEPAPARTQFLPEASPPPPASARTEGFWGEMSEGDLAEPRILQNWQSPEASPPGWLGQSLDTAGSEEPESIAWEEVAALAGPPPQRPSPEAPTSSAKVSPAEAAAALPVESAPVTGTDFSEILAAQERDAIARTALTVLHRRFPRAAIFAVRPQGVCSWAALGDGVRASQLRSVEIPWTQPSVFLNVKINRAFYLGPLPPLPRHQDLAEALGGWPEECVIQPVLIREKPVAFLYVDCAGARVISPMDLAYLRQLAAATASALAASIRRKKKEAI